MTASMACQCTISHNGGYHTLKKTMKKKDANIVVKRKNAINVPIK